MEVGLPVETELQTLDVQQDHAGVRTQFRWVVCALLFFATTINYIDRQILALIKPILDEQLKWTNEQFGYTNAFFQGAYALSLLIFGWEF